MPISTARHARQRKTVYPKTSQGNFTLIGRAWTFLPVATRAGFNALCAKMQQAGLLETAAHQTGCTVFMQLSRAKYSVYGNWDWNSAPSVPAVPPSPPEFSLTAETHGSQTQVTLHAPAFGVGCQVWRSRPFVPGIRDPFAQRLTRVGALPEGWPDGGTDLPGPVGARFWAPPGMAFVIKIVPVTADGFMGPSLSELCVAGE